MNAHTETRRRTPHVALLITAAVAAVAVSGCKATDADPAASSAPPAVTSAGPGVPNVVGQTLDVARTTLQSAGFGGHSHDLLRDRNQLVDRNWQICSQDPVAGPAAPAATVELGVVKGTEACPTAAPVTSSAAPTPTRAPATTVAPPAVPKPKPKPAPDPEPPADDDSGSSVGTVSPGAYCDPPGTGVTAKGTPMVCAPGSDGRNRWRSA